MFARLSDVGKLPQVPASRGRRLYRGGPRRGISGTPDPDVAGVAGEGGDEVSCDYAGWLAIAEDGDRASEVTLHLSFGERSVEPEMRGQASEDSDPLAEAS